MLSAKASVNWHLWRLASLLIWTAVLLDAPKTSSTQNQVMGELEFEGKTKLERDSGVWVDGNYVGYLKELKGKKKVLLLPGLMGTLDALDAMLKYADLDSFQYAVVDYRGYGSSKNISGLFTLREAVIDACKLIEYLGWRQFSVGGHSLGALVAQMLAVAMPHWTSAIVMIAGLSAKGAKSDPEREALLRRAAESVEARSQIVTGGTKARYSHVFARTLAP